MPWLNMSHTIIVYNYSGQLEIRLSVDLVTRKKPHELYLNKILDVFKTLNIKRPNTVMKRSI